MGRHSASPAPQDVEPPAARPGTSGRGTLGPITDPVLLDAIQRSLTESRAPRASPTGSRTTSARDLPPADPEQSDGTVWIETPFSGPVRIELPPQADAGPAQPAGARLPPPAPVDARRSSRAMPAATTDGRTHLVTTLDVLAAPRPAIPAAALPAAPTAAAVPASAAPASTWPDAAAPLPHRVAVVPPAEPRSAPFPPLPMQPAAEMRTDPDAAPLREVGASRDSFVLALGVGVGLAAVLSIVAVLPI